MTKETEKLLFEALKLAPPERARLAAELMASVDGEPESEAQAAWAAEIDRRMQGVLSGVTPREDWRAVHARISARLRSK